MEDISISITITTVDSSEKALEIAELLVNKKLSACVNIIPGITSVYFWDGKLCKEGEFLLLIKTRPELFENLKNFLREIHPYNLPEIIMVKAENCSNEYAKWIRDETTGSL